MIVWRKSSYSMSNGQCAEVAVCRCGIVKVRDSKRGSSSPILSFTGKAWETFVTGVKAGKVPA